jgi:hypothetical protein
MLFIFGFGSGRNGAILLVLSVVVNLLTSRPNLSMSHLSPAFLVLVPALPFLLLLYMVIYLSQIPLGQTGEALAIASVLQLLPTEVYERPVRRSIPEIKVGGENTRAAPPKCTRCCTPLHRYPPPDWYRGCCHDAAWTISTASRKKSLYRACKTTVAPVLRQAAAHLHTHTL